LIYPPNRPNKNKNFLKNKIKLVFVWPIRGVNQNNFILKEGKSEKNNYRGKTGNDLLTPLSTTIQQILFYP